MSKQKAPKAPDPVKTAAAQTQSNKETAITQANLNNVNQVDAYGNKLTYTQEMGPDGTPRFTATQTLSPAQQALLNTRQQTQQTNANQVQDALSQPFSLDNDATESRLMELGLKRLQPLLDQRRQAAETDLINRGIRPGSTNYGQAKELVDQGENDAYNQLLLNGRSQAINEALMQRNQPLYEQAALQGSGVVGPQYAQTPQTGVAGTDIAGLINQDYQNKLNSYNQSQSDLMGGLFGLGKAGLGMFNFAPITLSDKRLKKNIHDTGERVRGIPIKTWEWKGSGERDMGVVAQDVEKKYPHLVELGPDGYRRVKVGRLMAGAVR